MTQPSTAVIPQHPRIVVVVFPDGRGSLRLDDALHEIRGVSQRDAQHKAIHLVTTLAAKPQGRSVRVDTHSDQGRHQLLVSPDGTVAEAEPGAKPTTATPLPIATAGYSTAEAVALALPRQATRTISAGQLTAAGGATLLAAAVVASAAVAHTPRRGAEIDLTSAGTSGSTTAPTPTPSTAATPAAAPTSTTAAAPSTTTTSSTAAAPATTRTDAPPISEAASTPAPATAARTAATEPAASTATSSIAPAAPPQTPAATTATSSTATSTTPPTSATPSIPGAPLRVVLDIEADGPVHATLTIEANGQVQVQQNSGTAAAITVRPQGAPTTGASPAVVPATTASAVPTTAAPTPAPTAAPTARPTAPATASTTTPTSSEEPTWTAADDAELDEAIDAMTRAGDNADALAHAGITADADREESPTVPQTDSPTSTSTASARPAQEAGSPSPRVVPTSSAAPSASPGATPTTSAATLTSSPTSTASPLAQPTAQLTATQRASTPAATPSATSSTSATSTTDTREQQPAPVPVPDGEAQDGQDEQVGQKSTAAPTASPTTTSTTSTTAGTASSASTGAWLSGASGDGSYDGELGAWRGKPVQIGGTWADQGDNQTELWSIADGGEWAGFDGALDIAPGGLMAGESWSAAAGGAYDDRWRESLTKMAGLRADKGTTYIRPFHEFNLGGWDWSVQPGDAEDFKTAWARYRAIQRDVFPQARLVYGVNVTSSGTNLDWRTTWPGKDNADVLGVDTYNGWPTITSVDQFHEQANARGDGGIPIGLNAYSEQAREWGVPLAVPEWSGRAEMGDEAAYVEGMTQWFAKNAGTGPGQLEYEILFNAPQDSNNFKLYGDTRMPESSEAYQQAYSDGVASTTAAPASTAVSSPAATSEDAGEAESRANIDQQDEGQDDEQTNRQDDEQSQDDATSSTTAQQRSTTDTGANTTGTAGAVAADSSGGWLSGAAGDGVVDGSLGEWRGKPVQIAGTWQDSGDSQTQMWNLAPGAEFGDWDKPLDLAPGGMNDGDSWAAAASGAYDDRWREGLTKAAQYRAGKGTTYIRPFHEFNGTWYPWSVAPGQEEDFKAAWGRYRAIQQEVFPSAKLVYNPNVNSTAGLDWRKSWPGADQADVLGVDMYNGSPKRYDSAETWHSGLDATGDDGIAIGLNAYAAQAREWGVPLAVPEWSGRAEQGDDPAFITGIGTWFAENAGSGPGQLLYEVMFNVDRNEDNFRLFNGTRMPQSAEAYREVFSRPASNGGGATAQTVASRDDASTEATTEAVEQAADQAADETGGSGDSEGAAQSGDVNATAGFENRSEDAEPT